MEAIDPVWLFGGIALVSGILIGVMLQKRFSPASEEVEKLQAALEQVRSEKQEYQASVSRHFSKTSDLVNELTQDYVRVYRHLAEGAETLGNNPEFARALQQSQGRVLISVEDEEYTPASREGVIEPADIPAAAGPTAAPVDDDGAAAVVEESASQQGNGPNPPAGQDGDNVDPVSGADDSKGKAAGAVHAESPANS